MRPGDPCLHTPIFGLDPDTVLTPSVCNQLQLHAIEAYPHECIGYVRGGQYHRLENVSNHPEAYAAIPAELMAELLIDGIDALCHSHPNGPNCPSAADLRLQREMDVPHALVATNGQAATEPFLYGEGVQRPPLLGRMFIHGWLDCMSIVRDFAITVQGIEFDDFPRDWEWWCSYKEGEGGHYLENFAKWGYREVEGDLQVGDVFLLKAASKVPNHAGVYIGDHLLLHHLAAKEAYDHSRLSKIEPLIRWQQHGRIDKVLRHGG